MNYINSFDVERLGYGDSFLHKLNPFTKLIIMISSYIFLFSVNIDNQLIWLLILIILLKLSGFKIKNLIYILLFLLIPLFSFYILLLLIDYDNKFLSIIKIFFRMISLFMPILLYSSITSLKESIFVISKILKPIENISTSFYNLTILSFTIVITYFPILLNEFDNILLMKASRGEDIKETSFINKLKILYSSLFPVLVNSFLKADQMVDAIIIRRFNKDKKRSSYINYKIHIKDYIIIVFVLILLILFK